MKQLYGLVERLSQCSRDVRIGLVNVGEACCRKIVPKNLPDQEGVDSLLNQQRSTRVLQDVWVLQGLAQPGLPRDGPEQLLACT